MSEHTWKLWYSHHMRDRNDGCSRSLRFFSKLWHTLGLTHVTVVLLLVAYALLGERPAEEQRQSQLTMEIENKRREFSNTIIEYIHNCSRHANSVSNSQKPNSFNCSTGMEELIAGYERDTEPLRLAQPGPYNWGNFWNAVWYASTVFTTIGYGNLACKTFAGKLVTIFYALVGIPLTLVVLNNIGQLLFRKLSFAYTYCLKKTGRLKEKDSKESADSSEQVNFPLWMAVAIILIYVFVCGGLLSITEADWTFFDGMYFMFVSLSTIGFGDVMPTDPHDTLKASVIFIVGLSLISLCLSIINANMEQRYRETIITMQASIDQDDKDTAAAALQSVLFANRMETIGLTNGGQGEHNKMLEQDKGDLSAANGYPGIMLGVIPSQQRSRSPSLRKFRDQNH